MSPSSSRGPVPPASTPAVDSRLQTWRPAGAQAKSSGKEGGVTRHMVDLAMQNLHEVAKGDEPDQTLDAVMMYTRAVSMSDSRKRAGFTTKR